jgi:hypothetical protein
MDKPTEKTMKYMDYDECASWVAHKMGVKDLRDFAGKYTEGNKDALYLDFWFCILDNQDFHNPCFVWVDRDLNWPDWAIPIVDMFEQEFGPRKYWVGAIERLGWRSR